MGITRDGAKFADHLVRILNYEQDATATVSGWVRKVKIYKKVLEISVPTGKPGWGK